MTKLVINADDFGYSKGVNLGIIEAYKYGVVSSTTMMTNMPGAAHAAALALETEGIGVGIHLVLDCGKPLSQHVPSLVDEKGYFLKIDQLIERATKEDIEKELTSQIEKFLSFGLTPTHLDGHHHIHGYEEVYPIVEGLAKAYDLPIRKVSADPTHTSNLYLKTTEAFFHTFYGEDLEVSLLLDLINQSASYETVEIMCHPAFIDEPLLRGSSYSLPRVRELTILTESLVQKKIAEKNIQLCTYSELFLTNEES